MRRIDRCAPGSLRQPVTPSDLDGLHCGRPSTHVMSKVLGVTPSDLDGLHCGHRTMEHLFMLGLGVTPSDLDGLHCGMTRL